MEQGNNGCISIITQPSLNNENGGATKVKSTNNVLTNSTSRFKMFKEKLRLPLCKDEDPPIELAKKCLAEFLGTSVLICIGCMGCVGTLGNNPSYMQPSFTFGLAVSIAISAFGHISGAHLNPAVTIAAVVCGQKSFLGAVWYFFSQVLGAIFGYGLLKLVTPHLAASNSTTEHFCMTELHKDLSIYQGFGVEVIATAILIFIVCGTMDMRNAHNTDSTAIKFGLAVIGLCLAFGPYTGCSMNPARSLAPAIFNSNWNNQWLFWCGPITGALLASLLYQAVLNPPKDTSNSAS